MILMDQNRFPATPTRPNEVVFFMITNVEYKVPPNDSSNPTVDTYFGSTVGELGCWFDPDSTRMVQAGVDHSFVPDVGGYFGSGNIGLSKISPFFKYHSFQFEYHRSLKDRGRQLGNYIPYRPSFWNAEQ